MNIPFQLYLGGLLLIGLVVEALTKRSQPWAIPALVVYGTIFAWYFVDPFQAPEAYDFIPTSALGFGYVQVITFLVAFRLAVVWMTTRMMRRIAKSRPLRVALTPKQLFMGLVAAWLVLFAYGTTRLDGDVFAALFPLDGRNSPNMWGRDRVESGALGFIISSCSYTYLLVCSFFGITLTFIRQPALRVANLGMILLTWPFFLLAGSRNLFLAVSMPTFISYLIFSRQRVATKAVVTVGCSVIMFFLMLTVVQHRNFGFRFLFDPTAKEQVEDWRDQDTLGFQQEGLNMIQELCFTNSFVQSGVDHPAWGMGYLVELTSVIPRFLWPSKPELGADYARWRGFGSQAAEGELYATISTGVIGGGVFNFGVYLGPLAPALIMAAWCTLLAYWWTQRASILRAGLFLAGMGLTFNLGRDITLLVLWPIVFGYALTRVVEFLVAGQPRRGPTRLPAGRKLRPALES